MRSMTKMECHENADDRALKDAARQGVMARLVELMQMCLPDAERLKKALGTPQARSRKDNGRKST